MFTHLIIHKYTWSSMIGRQTITSIMFW